MADIATSQYETERMEKIQRNQTLLRSLGIQPKPQVAAPSSIESKSQQAKKKRKLSRQSSGENDADTMPQAKRAKASVAEPSRRSARQMGQNPEPVDSSIIEQISNEESSKAQKAHQLDELIDPFEFWKAKNHNVRTFRILCDNTHMHADN